MKKRQRDAILASVRAYGLADREVEISEVCGNGYITGKIFEHMKAIQAIEDSPYTAKYIKDFYIGIIQWAICGIYRANKMEALNVSAGECKDSGASQTVSKE